MELGAATAAAHLEAGRGRSGGRWWGAQALCSRRNLCQACTTSRRSWAHRHHKYHPGHKRRSPRRRCCTHNLAAWPEARVEPDRMGGRAARGTFGETGSGARGRLSMAYRRGKTARCCRSGEIGGGRRTTPPHTTHPPTHPPTPNPPTNTSIGDGRALARRTDQASHEREHLLLDDALDQENEVKE